ncbi:hypothetical protein L6164_032321 [Bauhinia variegata]|uniref:Uncharacterized protein n=1 Tax=Bauhinia variegata TaxID=167791 RepID=A0ACB9KNJ0_BAUVA|nr:hypothetical protein L6164_032321 [Bauhinia variegata]
MNMVHQIVMADCVSIKAIKSDPPLSSSDCQNDGTCSHGHKLMMGLCSTTSLRDYVIHGLPRGEGRRGETLQALQP